MSRERLDYLTRVLFSSVCAVFLVYVAWLIFSRFLSIALLLAAAGLLAFVISPLVDLLDRYLWRPLAVLLTYAGIAAVLVGGGYLLFGPVVAQLSDAVVHLPSNNALIQKRLQEIDRDLAQRGIQVHLAASQNKIVNMLQAQGGDVVSRTLTVASSIATLLLNALLCMVISIYLVLDGRRIHDRAFRLIPDQYRERFFFVEAAINTVVGGYVRGQLILELTIGTLAGVGCWWLGLPYPALLGVLAALLELVPMLGPMLASAPPILLALVSPHPWPLALKVLIYFFVIQQFETNFLGPRITGHAVGLHPVGAMVALLVGAELDGWVGAIVAAPVAGLLYVLVAAIYWHLTGQKVPVRHSRNTLSRAGRTLRRRAARGQEALNVKTPAVELAASSMAPPAQVRAVEEARDVLIARFEQTLEEDVRSAAEQEPPDTGTVDENPQSMAG